MGKGYGGVECSNDCYGYAWSEDMVKKMRGLHGPLMMDENFDFLSEFVGHHPHCDNSIDGFVNDEDSGRGVIRRLESLAEGEGFGGISCDNNCRNYAWDECSLAVVAETDPDIDQGLNFFNEYKGHHPACTNHPRCLKTRAVGGIGSTGIGVMSGPAAFVAETLSRPADLSGVHEVRPCPALKHIPVGTRGTVRLLNKSEDLPIDTVIPDEFVHFTVDRSGLIERSPDFSFVNRDCLNKVHLDAESKPYPGTDIKED